jgi:DNA-binding transcriptional LysR family regulator
METRQLRYFVQVAEELHFGRAAQSLGIAQPPLSQQIMKLEEELGVKLFQRTSRRVELTAAGKSLLEEARLILARIEAAREMARQVSEGISGSLNVGAVGPALDTFLPEWTRRLLTANPQVRVTLHELRSDQQIEWLTGGRLDIGFLRLYDHDLRGLSHRTILKQSYVLALPTRHPLTRRKSIPLAALHQVEMIMAPRRNRPSLHDRILTCLQAAGASIQIVQEASSKRTEIALVAAGIGAALVPEAYVHVFKRPGVVYRPLVGDLPPIEMVAVWPHDRITPLCHHFLSQWDDESA